MYTREEDAEEGCLDRKGHLGSSLETKDDGAKKKESVISPVLKHKEISSENNTVHSEKIDVKRKVAKLLKKNEEFSLSLGILFLPYTLGFAISYMLFYFYGGMPIESFITIEKGNMHFELWSIGAYLFITAGVIWAVLSLW